MLFADKEKFIDVENIELISTSQESVGNSMYEKFNCMSKEDGHFYAHIPQDFNIDINTTGHINGLSPGDSKLLAMAAHMTSKRGGVNIRRLKADLCNLVGATHVQVTSSLEAGSFSCQAGAGGFSVGRRLGIGKQGRIDSEGKVKIGSIFSNMRDL